MKSEKSLRRKRKREGRGKNTEKVDEVLKKGSAGMLRPVEQRQSGGEGPVSGLGGGQVGWKEQKGSETTAESFNTLMSRWISVY